MNKNQASRKTAQKPRKPRKSKQWFPVGWDEQRVRQVLAHYENQTDEERAAEIEAAFQAADQTLMAVPNELAPAIRKLIAGHQKTA